MKSSQATLIVYFEKKIIGELNLSRQGEYSFTYASHWLSDLDSFPISRSLPLSHEPIKGIVVQNYFGNLLPEEKIRLLLSEKHGISKDNDFALLSIIGRESAGALTILPETISTKQIASPYYEELSDEDIEGLLKELPKSPLLSTEKGISLSLAGAQNKLPLYFKDNQFCLPKFGAPSNCIIKPQIDGLHDSVENELYFMRLADAIGLPTAKTHFHNIKGQSFLRVDRYDRIEKRGIIQRLHQEDFCQALGFSRTMKYEKEGGPSLQECAGVILDHSSYPLPNLALLFKWTIFNVCIGNMDAHAKNISFLYKNKSKEITPLYDLLSTLYYRSRFKNKLAMSIDGQRESSSLTREHWLNLGESLHLEKEKALYLLQLIPELCLQKMTPIADEIMAKGVLKKVANDLLLFTAKNTRKILKQARL